MINKLSIVIPVYYNELNIQDLYKALEKEVLNRKEFRSELIFVDDGSKDSSFELLKELRKKDKRVNIIKLAKNHGSHIAILAGMSFASGDCLTMITADLQDPPEIINRMFDKWVKGNKVVLAVRKGREDSLIQSFLSNSYYKLFKKLALSRMPEGGFDCFLIDKDVVDILVKMQEKNSSLMGQILWSGFEPALIYYTRRKRKAGKSRWTFSKKVKYFADSFVAFSYFPIKLVSSIGMLISILGFLYALFILANKITRGINVEGWTSMMIIFLIISGVQLLTVGIIGEYLWRNYDETRKRPIFVIEKKIGFSEDNH